MDHIANMLVGITNAAMVKHKTVEVLHNKVCEDIIKILVEKGYCKSFEVQGDVKKTIKIELKYTEGKSAIKNLRRVSKSSLRKYSSSADIWDVKNGLGLLIISTSKGIMTGRQAKRANLGGEVLVAVDE